MHFVNDGKCKQWKLYLVMCISLTFLLAGHCALMAEADDTNGVLRSRAYKFHHITSQQTHEMLLRLKIGKSFDALSDNVLIVTSDIGSDLVKTTGVITILDQPKPVGIRVLLVKTDQQPLPDIDVLRAAMKTFSVGTMMDAPPKGAEKPVILDILDNKLIAIAAEELLPEIEKAVEAWKETNLPQPPSEQMVEGETSEQEQPETTKAAVEPAAQTEEPESKQETTAEPQEIKQETSLEDIMVRLLEEEEEESTVPKMVPLQPEKTEAEEEDLMGMLETEPNTTEEYIGDELLKVLLEEEKKTQPQPEKGEALTEAQIAVQPELEIETKSLPEQKELGEEKTLQQAIELLLKASPKEKPTQTTVPVAAEEPQRSDAVSENLRLQREIAILHQQMAEIQGQKTASGESQEVEESESEKPEPKIITQKATTQTEFEKAIGDKELETVIDLPQEVELENLVDLVGKQLGLNYMYDPAILKNQKVFLKIHQGKIKVKDLYGLLESVLRFRGFVMTRRDDLVTIIKSADANQVAAQVDTVFRTPGDPIQPGDIIVSTIFQLDNIGTDTAKKMLTAMKLGLANGFQEIPETNTLIVTDYAYRMARIEEVLAMVDVAGDEKIFEYRSLKYMQAAELVTKVKELVGQMEGVSMQVNAGPAAPATPTKYTTQRVRNPQTGRIETKRVPVETPPTQAGGPSKTEKKDTVYINTDERTNRILMIGTQSQIDTINQLVDTLDVPQFDLRVVKEYVIQNVEAIEVVNVLNELGLANIKVSTSGASTSTTAAQRAAAARGGQPQQAAAPSTSTSSGGADQPSISIRPATNSLLVNGTEEQHQAIELVIAHVDVVQKDQRTIREYEIQYVDTQEIIDTMTELGMISSQSIKGGTSSTSGRSTSTGRTSRTAAQQQTAPEAGAGAVPTLTGLAGEEGSAEDITAQEPQIAILEATNSLLVYATPRQHKAISLLIAHADRVPETTTTPYVVYALENQDPLELSEVLTKLIQETVEEKGKTSTPESKIQTSGAAAGGGTVPTLEEERIRIIPDEMSYSLIVYANKRNQQWIAELIQELDEYRPQVLLDCTLVEITKDDAFNYSLNLISKSYDGTSIQTGSPVAADAIYGDFSNTGTLGDISSIGGDVTAFLNTGSVQAVLTAIQTNGYGRVMAQPKILVNDNQEGEIKTENKTSIAQQKSIVQPATGTSPSYTTTDVSFSEYIEGVTLTIKPHISKGDMLRLEITLSRIDFTERTDVTVAGATYPRPPDLLSTDVTTIATVPDGTTIVLGGLESVDQNKSQDKVPILGDLPLVGALFRGVDNTDAQSRLYVFVKANIIRPGDQVEGIEDVKRVSQKYREKFEEMEEKFQGLQDVPAWNSKPMDPISVLEDDMEIDATGK
ncbi:MAG: hypothetical protein ISS71_04970 [Phycisphaerae bacterium]|nr:hypothetical protein [Phycisphaerae bacterium]